MALRFGKLLRDAGSLLPAVLLRPLERPDEPLDSLERDDEPFRAVPGLVHRLVDGLVDLECGDERLPFGQVDDSHTRRHEGTGLGLPLAQRLAELHGGSLVVSSVKGRGTIVTVTMPPERTVAKPVVSETVEDN